MDQPPETTVAEPSREELIAQMRSEAEAEDRADSGIPAEESPSTQTGDDDAAEASPDRATDGATDKTKSTPDSPEPSADKTTPERGPDGKFLKKPVGEPQGDKPSLGEQQPLTKEEKDKARLAEQWKRTEADKLEARQALAEARQTRQELAQLKQEFEAQQSQQKQSGGPRFGSKEYERASYEFRQRGLKLLKDGDIDAANEQFNLEEQTRAAAFESSKQEFQQSQNTFQGQWNSIARDVIREVPELGDGTTEVSKEMTKLLTDFPVLGYVQDGFKHGYEILKLRKEAAEASGLREENKTLKTENERLKKASAPTVVKDAAKHSSPDKDKSLTWDQARKEAEAYDAAA